MLAMRVSTSSRAADHTARSKGLPVAHYSALGCLLACTLLAGCSMIEKLPGFDTSTPTPAPRIEKPPPSPRPLPPVTILLSDDLPAYSGIADELSTRLTEPTVVISLHGDSDSNAVTPELLQQTDKRPVVAIGPLAAQTATRLTAGQIVFCQVFNYHTLGQGTKHMQGVSFLPPAELQFRAWKKLDPGLQRVGVITGPGHKELIAEARRAARHHGIELIHRTVQSDKEMLYDFKRLTPEIQGLWLLPDDRILSRRVLREIMSYSAKHQHEVVVFHPELLRFGGLMSISSVEADVADQVIAALHAGPRHTGVTANNPLPLKQLRIEVNPKVAQSLDRRSAPQPQVAADAP
jgi:ABC-type uncharacterized transport system substrate-binding protein